MKSYCIKATLQPKNQLNIVLLKNIVDKAYWPIYGDMRVLEEVNNPSENCSTEGTCPEPIAIFFTYIALMIYMVLANVLLLNLLIAMFR